MTYPTPPRKFSEDYKDYVAAMLLKVVEEVGRTVHSAAVAPEPTGVYVPKDVRREVMRRSA